MYCSNCGEKNNEFNNFCGKCGKSLKNKTIESSGAKRKAIKEEARKIISGTVIGGNALYTGVTIFILTLLMFSYIGTLLLFKNSFLNGIFLLILFFMFVFLPLLGNFSLLSTSIDSFRNKDVSLEEYIKKPFINFKNFIFSFIAVFIITGIYTYFTSGFIEFPILNIFIIVITTVAYVYFYPVVEVLVCMYADSNYKKTSFKEMIKSAMKLINNHRVEYYAMMISFIGWSILSIFTFGLLFLWVIPYMRMSMANMYLNWTEEKNSASNKPGISNGAIIGISCGVYGIFLVFVFIIAMVLSYENFDFEYEYYPNTYSPYEIENDFFDEFTL